MPVWFGVAVLAREVLVGAMMAVATVVFKMPRIDVTYLGKLATFLLMFAVPGFLMGNSDIAGADGFLIAAWILGVPGLVLSYWTAIAYIPQVRRAIEHGRAGRAHPTPAAE
jgi:cardiolipin synthase